MTGSADKAREIIEKLRKVGAETPYELEGLASTVQLLMQYGMTADQAYESTLQLGDISQGSATKMQGIALALGQMSSYGKVTLQDIKQMIGNGFNPLQEISRTTGESMTSLYDRISKGTLKVEEVTKAFKTASSEGGSYFQSMEKQSKTLNGQLSTLSDNFNELTGSTMREISDLLVDKILPKTNELLSNITENMPTIIEQFSSLLKKVIDIIPYLEAIGIIVVGWKIGTIIQGVIQGFQKAQIALSLYSLQTNGASIAQGLLNGTLTLGETLVGLFTGKVTLAQLATAGLTKAQAALSAVMAANPIAIVVLAIAALIAIFVVLWNKCESFRNFWIGLWEKIKSAFETAWNAIVTFFTETIPNAFQSLKNKLSEIGNNIATFFQNLWNSIVSFFTETIPKAFQASLDKITAIGNNIKEFFKKIWNDIISFFTEAIPQWIQNVINWFSNLPYAIGYQIGLLLGNIIKFGNNVWIWVTVELPKIIQAIIDWFAQLPGKIWNWLVNTYNNIIEWATSIYSSILEWFSKIIDTIVTYFSELPSKIWEWLVNTHNKLKEWAINVYNTSKTWIVKTITIIVDWFAQLPGKIWNWLLDTINKVVEWGRNVANKGKQGAQDLYNNIVHTIKELPGKMLDIGKNIVEGLWNGIKNATGWIKSKVKDFAQGILDGMKESLGIHSPSSKARDLVR